MVATSYIVPDFETGFSGFDFWRNNEGNNKIADDQKLCKPVALHARADIIVFFYEIIDFFNSNHFTYYSFYAIRLCNSLGICHIHPSTY